MPHDDLTPADWAACLRVLRRVADDPSVAEAQLEVQTLVAKINRRARKQERRASADTRAATVPRGHGRKCYICKARQDAPHPSNALLCHACGELNARKRMQRTDLTGRVAVLTGGRIKIGYATSLRLLRDGARVIVTTRFPADAARRYAQEPDFDAWRSRLTLYGLDGRDLRAVQEFIGFLHEREAHLDILINNAAQTISRPPDFYAHLLSGERQALPDGGAGITRARGADLRLLRAESHDALAFPPGMLDADGQQLDLRAHNSWGARLADVSTRELLEVQLVNATMPFMLCSQLKPLLLRSPFARRFIVNVSAMEGQFARVHKTERHPHTNMAKAALNMLTRTSGMDYARDGIYMTSVDTGWVTNEHPFPVAQRMSEAGFVTPLDVEDGAARVYDPIVTGVDEAVVPAFGVFLKDYRPYPW